MVITLHVCCVSMLPPSSTTDLGTHLLCPSECAGLFTHLCLHMFASMSKASSWHGHVYLCLLYSECRVGAWAHLFACMFCPNITTWWDTACLFAYFHALHLYVVVWAHVFVCLLCRCTAPCWHGNASSHTFCLPAPSPGDMGILVGWP